MIRWMMCADHLSSGQVASAFDGTADLTLAAAGAGRNGREAFAAAGNIGTKLCSTGGVAWGQTTLFMAQACKANTTPSTLFDFRDGAATQVTLYHTGDGRLQFFRGDAGAALLAETAVGAMPLSPAFPHLAIKVKVDPSTGTVALRIDGVPVNLYTGGGTLIGTEATGLNTRATGVTQITAVRWRGNGTTLHDLMVWDTTGTVNNDWLGDKAVIYDAVTGNGGENDTTIGGSTPAATRWQGVDEIPADDDVSYNSYATGDAQLYTWAGIPTARRGVVALAPVNRWRKDDAGSNIMRSLLRPSTGSDVEGHDVALTTSYGDFLGKIEEVDPVTSAAWQPGDAPQIGAIRNT